MKIGRLVLKTILWVVGIAGIGYILLVCFLLFAPKLNSYTDRVSFESSQWKAHLVGQDPIKLKMVDDLLSKHNLVGLSTTEVEALLGKPLKNENYKDYDYVYWLGPERSTFSIDSEWLGIKFQNGIVIKVDLLRD